MFRGNPIYQESYRTGRTLYWIEKHPVRGFRLCRRCKRTLRTNWALLGGEFYILDGRLEYSALTEFHEVPEIYRFIRRFPLGKLDNIEQWIEVQLESHLKMRRRSEWERWNRLKVFLLEILRTSRLESESNGSKG